MRVLLSTYDSRGGVEPLVGLAVQLQELGVEVRVAAPPDEEYAERLAAFGVPVYPYGESVRAMMTSTTAASEEGLRHHVDDLIAAQFDVVAAAAQGCDALVSTGLVWTAAGARSVTEKLGIHYVYACYHPTHLPSPHHPPPSYWGVPFTMFMPDNRVLWEQDAQNANTLLGPTLNAHRQAIGLPPVDSVRDYAYTQNPWLAADPALGPWLQPAELDVFQTGAWLLRDERPLPDDLLAFLDAGSPPVYVGFGSMPSSADILRIAIAAIRAQGRRVLLGSGWAGLELIDDRADCFAIGEVNQQELFGRVAAVVHHGGAGTTTTTALSGAPQLVIPHGKDQLYWAGRVGELGIGAAYDGRNAGLESLSAALALTLTPEARKAARAVAAKVRTDGAAVAAARLVDEISRERPSATLTP